MQASLIFKSHFRLSSPYLRYALRLTIACFITITLYMLLEIANGFWVAFSVLACTWPTQGLSMQRIRQRLLGTFLGMWLGILVAHFFIMQGWVIDAILPVFIFLMFYFKAYDYSLYVLFITVVTMLFVCLLVPGDWQVAWLRLGLTLLGVFIAFLSTLFIFPVHESQRLPEHVQLATASLKDYFLQLHCRYHGHNDHALQAIQAASFDHLQVALSALHESRFEWRQRQDGASSAEIQRLHVIYEKLLCLEVHMPTNFHCEHLQLLYAPLGDMMKAMAPLFDHADAAALFKVNTQLATVQASIKARRIYAAQNPTLKAAIFHESMQLTLFIDTLQQLLVHLHPSSV